MNLNQGFVIGFSMLAFANMAEAQNIGSSGGGSGTSALPTGTNFIGFTLDALNSGWVAGTSVATRVALVNTGTTAGTLVSAYSTLKGEIVDLECFRQDAGTTTAWITFNDSVSTQIVLPVGGGASPPIRVPIKSTGTNTAITFTNSQSIAVSCNAGVYGGT